MCRFQEVIAPYNILYPDCFLRNSRMILTKLKIKNKLAVDNCSFELKFSKIVSTEV